MREFQVGDHVRFKADNGSRGRIEGFGAFAGFYVRWHYGTDVRGDQMTALSACRPDDLVRVGEDELSRAPTEARAERLTRALEDIRYRLFIGDTDPNMKDGGPLKRCLAIATAALGKKEGE